MSARFTLAIALRALAATSLQTALTMIGMTIGVGAVLTMMALGTGAEAAIEAAGARRRHEPHRRHGRQLQDEETEDDRRRRRRAVRVSARPRRTGAPPSDSGSA